MVRVSVAMAIIAVMISAMLFSPVFKIKSVEFSAGQNCLKDQKQLDKYQVIGRNILFYKSGEFAQNLKNDFSCIDRVTVKKQYPNKLKIEMSSQLPVAKIDGTDLTVTKNGAVSQSKPAGLPTIFLPANVSTSQDQNISNPVILFALDVVSQLQKSDFIAQNVRIVENNEIAVYDTHGTIALFSSSKSASLQVDSLQAILAKAKIDQNKIAKIDLRFDKPVMVNR